eukprot:TRINITY_DN80741_c0_g1_i1.p1 TRINITY_DN80741_c0_g1~~TRINITY_DN80741_c0_g1_i1.p1  ORF type:complete len:117 (+),score=16.63 TRINITY_DN80741_c0_g1_i1:42-353(+)
MASPMGCQIVLVPVQMVSYDSYNLGNCPTPMNMTAMPMMQGQCVDMTQCTGIAQCAGMTPGVCSQIPMEQASMPMERMSMKPETTERASIPLEQTSMPMEQQM